MNTTTATHRSRPASGPAATAKGLAGALAAAAATWALYGQQAKTVAHLGATYPAAGVSLVFGTEATVTFLLVLVIVSVATSAASLLA